MNKIFLQIEEYMHEALKSQLPNVAASELEDKGAVFYMNGKNGTAFDWYVNEHFPCFFIFYNDRENLGAVKATLYTDGNMTVYVYGDKGHAKPVELQYKIDADEKQLFDLAVLLTKNADGKRKWDANIKKLKCDGVPDEKTVSLFTELKDAFGPSIEMRDMMGCTAIVSKKIREEGWKIGYGIRMEPTREGDSGWCFSVGNETEDYINDPQNLELWSINGVLSYAPELSDFISEPYGTAVVRSGHDEFEPDAPGKDILIEKK